MLRLFHVSDSGPYRTMTPRPSPPGTAHAGRAVVWAVDEQHLPHYLLPRQCPRVCWATAAADHPLLGSPTARVVAVEHAWAPELLGAGLTVHQLDPSGFTLVDPVAGYWVSEHDVEVHQVQHLDDCFTALAERHVELRLTPSLWPYVDAVVAAAAEFSAIRMRNARARSGG